MKRSSTFLAALFATSALASPAVAQSTTQPAFRQPDANGVDLTRGDFVLNFIEASIGSGDAALTLARLQVGSQASQWDGLGFYKSVSGSTVTVTVGLGGTSETFTKGASNLARG
jgi:hypothetical protein